MRAGPLAAALRRKDLFLSTGSCSGKLIDGLRAVGLEVKGLGFGSG